MAISSSSIVEDRVQAGGRRSVRERHTDHLGIVHEVSYLAESGANVGAAMATRVSQLEAALEGAELARNLAGAYLQQSPTFNHCTVAQFRSVLREAFKTATKFEVVALGKFIHTQNLTDTQLKNLFGVNDAQLPALKTKLSSLAAKWTDIEAQVGQ